MRTESFTVKASQSLAKIMVGYAILACIPGMSAQRSGFTMTVSSTPDQYGVFDVVIKNRSSKMITAAKITHTCYAPDRQGPSTHSIGFDAALTFYLGKGHLSAGIAPGTERHFDLIADAAKCPAEVGVIYADGRGEGTLSKQLSADRRITYAEVLQIKDLFSKIPEEQDNFAKTLFESIDSRGFALRDLPRSEISNEEQYARGHVINTFLQMLRFPERVPDALKSRKSTLVVLDQWLATLSTAIQQEDAAA